MEQKINRILCLSDRRAMTSKLHMNFILKKTKNIEKYVECGVAKGGALALIAANNPNVKIYGLDAWKGMPPLSSKDEKSLQSFVGNRKKHMYGNEKIVYNSFKKINASTEKLFLIKGWVEDTIPKNIESLRDIDVLRIDVDWYKPVLFVLENLYFNIKKGGIVIIDDGCYKGCREAVNEFRTKNNIDNKIFRGVENGCNEGEEFWWYV